MYKRTRLGIILLIAICSMTMHIHAASNLTQQLDDIFLPVFNDPGAPGAAICITQHDTVLYERYLGLADLDTREPISKRTNFCIASVSKQFAAVALLQLVEQGLITLDQPINVAFPEFKAPFYSHITWRHLLTHTSGIPDARSHSDRNFVLYATDVASTSYLKDLDRLNFQPGTAYEYINPTFQLIYQLVERVTGVDFETYVQCHLLDPAGMTMTQYFEPQRTISHMAHGYTPAKQGGGYVEFDYGEESFFATKADGALYTSITDFLKWERALRDHKVWSMATQQAAYTPHVMIHPEANYGYSPGTGYGYGFFVQQRPARPTVVYHTGDNGGFTIYAGKIPERDIVVLIFSTRDNIDRTHLVESTLSALLDN